jgi:hypothetical protein
MGLREMLIELFGALKSWPEQDLQQITVLVVVNSEI